MKCKQLMTEWQTDFTGSFYNYLPRGCQICRMGAGLVLFVTGRCTRHCFYCPLSVERKDIDSVYADEQPVKCMEDILEEGRSIVALGTGITGGEPLLKLSYVKECIQALKQEFGKEHHIHLYTGVIPNQETLLELRDAGLDEIRIHPSMDDFSNAVGLRKALSEAKSIGLEAGVEMPALAQAPEIVETVKNTGAFLNINELEFSETNAESLKGLGFESQEFHCGALGSEEIAKAYFMDVHLKVHFCTSRFKDAVQLRERLKRRAKRVARQFDEASEDGTLIYGVIEGDLHRALMSLKDLQVPREMYSFSGDRIEISAFILEEISKELKSIGLNVSIVERYPLEGGLVVERIPL
jgi:pyruvate formate-lyase activating enzyme-like uncharacterized protein